MFFPVRPNSTRNKKSKTTTSPSSVSKTKQQQKQKLQQRPKASSRSSTKDPEPTIPTARSSTSESSSHSAPHRRSSMPGLDAASPSRTASFLESRTSLPYPSFSKAHSKEDVRKPNIPTPDPTDLTEDKENGTSDERNENHHAPPSPPLTGLDRPSSRKGSAVGEKEEKGSDKAKKKASIKIRTEVNRSSSSLRSKKDGETKSSKTARADTPPKNKSSKPEKEVSSPRTSHKSSKPKTSDEKKPHKRSSHSTMSPSRSNVTIRDGGAESNGSDVTSIAPNQQYTAPRKSMTPPMKPPSRNQIRSSLSHRHTPGEESIEYGRHVAPGPAYGAPPPPPPPPPAVPVSIPRVDYLLQHGGLENRVPRTLLAGPSPSHPFSQQATQPQLAAAQVFDPFNRLLDDYRKVMNKNGSLAVATGYRSVARRLLDRLEAVFARDISSEPCCCLMCDRENTEERPEGVSWGEVLELVSGRRELPMWPPFMMAPSTMDAVPGEEHIPMQKLDVDVPDEYRDHFIRQSRKTKVAVDKWLSEQNEQAGSAPEEVDDETLTFAMLTHLEPHHRSLFCALLGINSATPVLRADDERPRQKPSALLSSSLAIQRLYRLQSRPRDPETAMFMLNNPGLHHILATLAAISDDEWEILISGRFDGFLRSGAEDAIPAASNPRWSGSRSNTPFSATSHKRGPTPSYDGSFRPASQPSGEPSSPASFGGPIALDEETEIAALAEIERDIFLGMEALEDAFEALHCKAEIVRRALRERGAGLSVANQSRRGSYVEARLGTPFSVNAWESGTEDDFLDDDRSLAPDDSASNISSNGRRRPKRRTERRTPAPVEEEDEEALSHVGRREGRNSRRR